MTNKKYQLTIGWLYPELMSTYGDKGNIIVLQKRAGWRGIATTILAINEQTTDKQIAGVDLLFGGGAQDREQEIVMQDLQKKKKSIAQLITNNIPSLFVCGAPQLFGIYYEPAVGKKIKGLGIFDMYSAHPGEGAKRLIGNLIAKIEENNLPNAQLITDPYLVGFENHGGRTYLGKGVLPFARVLKGNGNNGQDGTEGIVYKNAIGCYLHGPLLPKNPQIADWLLATALEIKYKEKVALEKLDDSLENMAKSAIAKRLGVAI